MSNINKFLVIEMEDGSEWAVRVADIAAYRANYYAKKNRLPYPECLVKTMTLFEDDFEIEDWAANNMNWTDVEDVAQCIQFAQVDMQEGWCNGEKSIRDITSEF
jgi:hypothetical protein